MLNNQQKHKDLEFGGCNNSESHLLYCSRLTGLKTPASKHKHSNQRGDWRGLWGEKGEGFSGTTIKNTWTKPRGVESGEGGGDGWGGVGRGKCRQL